MKPGKKFPFVTGTNWFCSGDVGGFGVGSKFSLRLRRYIDLAKTRKDAFLKFVPSGVASVAELQGKGFAYLKVGQDLRSPDELRWSILTRQRKRTKQS